MGIAMKKTLGFTVVMTLLAVAVLIFNQRYNGQHAYSQNVVAQQGSTVSLDVWQVHEVSLAKTDGGATDRLQPSLEPASEQALADTARLKARDTILASTDQQQLALLPAMQVYADGQQTVLDTGYQVSWAEAEAFIADFDVPDYVLRQQKLNDSSGAAYSDDMRHQEDWAMDADAFMRIYLGLPPEQRVEFENRIKAKYERLITSL